MHFGIHISLTSFCCSFAMVVIPKPVKHEIKCRIGMDRPRPKAYGLKNKISNGSQITPKPYQAYAPYCCERWVHPWWWICDTMPWPWFWKRNDSEWWGCLLVFLFLCLFHLCFYICSKIFYQRCATCCSLVKPPFWLAQILLWICLRIPGLKHVFPIRVVIDRCFPYQCSAIEGQFV